MATQDSLILVRSQSATSLVTIETWMGDRFGEKKTNYIYIMSIWVSLELLQIKLTVNDDITKYDKIGNL